MRLVSATWPALSVSVLLHLSGCVGGTTHDNGNSDGSTTRPAASQPSSSGRASDRSRTYDLDTLATSSVAIGGNRFRVWLAQEFDQTRSALLQEGLMWVPTSEIADDQGMLFVFGDERVRSFWMLNTIAPLDIAFARFDGTIVAIWQMPPRTLQQFSSIEPAMFALEMKQGTFARLGIREGDKLVYPADVLQAKP